MNRLTTPSDAWINAQLGYDTAGRLSRMVDWNGNATDYTFNSWGRPESTIEPVTAQYPPLTDRTWTTAYDAAGQPVMQSLPGGVTRSRTFDGLGRLTVETGSGAEATTAERRIGYDSLGRPTMLSGPAGNTTYTWNDRGLLTAVCDPSTVA